MRAFHGSASRKNQFLNHPPKENIKPYHLLAILHSSISGELVLIMPTQSWKSDVGEVGDNSPTSSEPKINMMVAAAAAAADVWLYLIWFCG